LDDAAVDRHTRYRVRLFLHGVVPRDRRSNALEEENVRLRSSMSGALTQVDQARERLEAALQTRRG
jgi:TetR/AcrR family transcriptional regulator, mexJK operon transcriptional repressor